MDYYFTKNVSAFAEYKYLTYEDFSFFNDGPHNSDGPIIPKTTGDFGQHLFTLGVRIGFGGAPDAPVKGAMNDGKACKNMIEPAPEVYGLGWYGALQTGFNLYQNLPTFDPSVLATESDPGTLPNATANSNVGGLGGAKLGYVFNTGKIRPALEADLFYNGFGYNYEGRDGSERGEVAGHVDSLAYMSNLIVRFDLGRVQPYVGAGIGGYWGESKVTSISSWDLNTELNHSFSHSNSSFAWQIIAGTDYYFTKKMSAFIEYKFLNYENFSFFNDGPKSGSNSILPKTTASLGQQLLTLGVRIHF